MPSQQQIETFCDMTERDYCLETRRAVEKELARNPQRDMFDVRDECHRRVTGQNIPFDFGSIVYDS